MNIPEAAVDAVLDIIKERDARDGIDRDFQDYVTIAVDIHEELTAAAPFIAAQALRDAAEDFGDDTWESVWAAADVDDDVSAVQATVAWLRTVADDLEAGK